MTIDSDRVEYYINFLTGIATGGDYKVADTEYKQIRVELLKTTDAAIRSRIPTCVKSSFDGISFFKYMQNFGGYQGRRVQIRKEFLPMSDYVNGVEIGISLSTEKIIEAFNSEYITKQIEYMMLNQKNNPTEAIGKAKELIESCCTTILKKLGEPYTKDDDISTLTKKVRTKLNLIPESIQDDKPLAETLKGILGNLGGISKGIAELRNSYGAGHGKPADYKGLQERHAKLAVGSAVALVNFLWDSYELQTRFELH
jgi:hypothetical protein